MAKARIGPKWQGYYANLPVKSQDRVIRYQAEYRNSCEEAIIFDWLMQNCFEPAVQEIVDYLEDSHNDPFVPTIFYTQVSSNKKP